MIFCLLGSMLNIVVRMRGAKDGNYLDHFNCAWLAFTEQVQIGFVRCHVYSGCGFSVLILELCWSCPRTS